MILAIERTKFTYLYKYNQIIVDINQIIDLSVIELTRKLKSDFEFVVNELNRVMPLFEQDHEILLLEFNKENLSIQGKLTIGFKAVTSIYPLSNIGKQLLSGKLNEKFEINQPVFEKAIEEVKIIRSIENRYNATNILLSCFSLSNSITETKLTLLKNSLRKLLIKETSTNDLVTYLDFLLSYNKTPSYIPDGNVEFLCKIGAIAMKFIGKPEEILTNGPFYKSCLRYKGQINNRNIHNSYYYFLSSKDEELTSSYKKIREFISKDFVDIDIFKTSYYFLAFKSYLIKNDFNLIGLEEDIICLKSKDDKVAAFVLSLLGFAFSFDQLYESIHILSKAPLFKGSLEQKNKIQKNSELINHDNLKINKEIQDFKKIDLSNLNLTENKLKIKKIILKNTNPKDSATTVQNIHRIEPEFLLERELLITDSIKPDNEINKQKKKVKKTNSLIKQTTSLETQKNDEPSAPITIEPTTKATANSKETGTLDLFS